MIRIRTPLQREVVYAEGTIGCNLREVDLDGTGKKTKEASYISHISVGEGRERNEARLTMDALPSVCFGPSDEHPDILIV